MRTRKLLSAVTIISVVMAVSLVVVVKTVSAGFSTTSTVDFGDWIRASCNDGANVFYGTANSNPTFVYKTDVFSNALPIGGNILVLNPGESNLRGGYCDSSSAHAYFITETYPAKVVKILKASNTREGVLTLTGTGLGRGLVGDGSHLYAATDGSSPAYAMLSKIDLASFSVSLQTADIGTQRFSDINPCAISTSTVVCGFMDSNIHRYLKSNLARDGSLATPGYSALRAATIDATQSFGLFFAAAGVVGILKVSNVASVGTAMAQEAFKATADLTGYDLTAGIARSDGTFLFVGQSGWAAEIDGVSLDRVGAAVSLSPVNLFTITKVSDVVAFAADSNGNSLRIAMTFTACPGSSITLSGLSLASSSFSLPSGCSLTIRNCFADVLTWSAAENMRLAVTNLTCSPSIAGGDSDCLVFGGALTGNATNIGIDGVVKANSGGEGTRKVVRFGAPVTSVHQISIKRVVVSYAISAVSGTVTLPVILFAFPVSSSGDPGSFINVSQNSISGSVTTAVTVACNVNIVVFNDVTGFDDIIVAANRIQSGSVFYSSSASGMNVFMVLFNLGSTVRGNGGTSTNITIRHNSMDSVSMTIAGFGGASGQLHLVQFRTLTQVGHILLYENSMRNVSATSTVKSVVGVGFHSAVDAQSISVLRFDMTQASLAMTHSMEGLFWCVRVVSAVTITLAGGISVSSVWLGGAFSYAATDSALRGARVLDIAGTLSSVESISVAYSFLDFSSSGPLTTTAANIAAQAYIALFDAPLSNIRSIILANCSVRGSYSSFGASANVEVGIVIFKQPVSLISALEVRDCVYDGDATSASGIHTLSPVRFSAPITSSNVSVLNLDCGSFGSSRSDLLHCVHFQGSIFGNTTTIVLDGIKRVDSNASSDRTAVLFSSSIAASNLIVIKRVVVLVATDTALSPAGSLRIAAVVFADSVTSHNISILDNKISLSSSPLLASVNVQASGSAMVSIVYLSSLNGSGLANSSATICGNIISDITVSSTTADWAGVRLVMCDGAVSGLDVFDMKDNAINSVTVASPLGNAGVVAFYFRSTVTMQGTGTSEIVLSSNHVRNVLVSSSSASSIVLCSFNGNVGGAAFFTVDGVNDLSGALIFSTSTSSTSTPPVFVAVFFAASTILSLVHSAFFTVKGVTMGGTMNHSISSSSPSSSGVGFGPRVLEMSGPLSRVQTIKIENNIFDFAAVYTASSSSSTDVDVSMFLFRSNVSASHTIYSFNNTLLGFYAAYADSASCTVRIFCFEGALEGSNLAGSAFTFHSAQVAPGTVIHSERGFATAATIWFSAPVRNVQAIDVSACSISYVSIRSYNGTRAHVLFARDDVSLMDTVAEAAMSIDGCSMRSLNASADGPTAGVDSYVLWVGSLLSSGSAMSMTSADLREVTISVETGAVRFGGLYFADLESSGGSSSGSLRLALEATILLDNVWLGGTITNKGGLAILPRVAEFRDIVCDANCSLTVSNCSFDFFSTAGDVGLRSTGSSGNVAAWMVHFSSALSSVGRFIFLNNRIAGIFEATGAFASVDIRVLRVSRALSGVSEITFRENEVAANVAATSVLAVEAFLASFHDSVAGTGAPTDVFEVTRSAIRAGGTFTSTADYVCVGFVLFNGSAALSAIQNVNVSLGIMEPKTNAKLPYRGAAAGSDSVVVVCDNVTATRSFTGSDATASTFSHRESPTDDRSATESETESVNVSGSITRSPRRRGTVTNTTSRTFTQVDSASFNSSSSESHLHTDSKERTASSSHLESDSLLGTVSLSQQQTPTGETPTAERTLTPTHYVEPRPDIAVPVQQELADTALIFTTVTGAANVASVQQLQRSGAVLIIAKCGEASLDALGYAHSPLQLEIGSDWLRYHRGAVVGNVALVAGALLLYALAIPIMVFGLKKRYDAVILKLRFPSYLFTPASLLAAPTAISSAALFWYGRAAGDVVGVAIFVGGLLAFVPLASLIAIGLEHDGLSLPLKKVVVASKEMKQYDEQKLRQALEKKRKEEAAAAAAAEKKDVDFVIAADGTASNEETTKKKKSEEADVAPPPVADPAAVVTLSNTAICKLQFFRCLYWLCRPSHRWPQMHPFVIRYFPIFYPTSKSYFPWVDWTTTIVVSIVSGLTASPTASKTVCIVSASISITILLSHFLVLVFVRPILGRAAIVIGLGLGFIAIVSALLALLVLAEIPGVGRGAGGLVAAGGAMAMAGAIFSAIDAVVDTYELLFAANDVRKRRKKKKKKKKSMRTRMVTIVMTGEDGKEQHEEIEIEEEVSDHDNDDDEEEEEEVDGDDAKEGEKKEGNNESEQPLLTRQNSVGSPLLVIPELDHGGHASSGGDEENTNNHGENESEHAENEEDLTGKLKPLAGIFIQKRDGGLQQQRRRGLSAAFTKLQKSSRLAVIQNRVQNPFMVGELARPLTSGVAIGAFTKPGVIDEAYLDALDDDFEMPAVNRAANNGVKATDINDEDFWNSLDNKSSNNNASMADEAFVEQRDEAQQIAEELNELLLDANGEAPPETIDIAELVGPLGSDGEDDDNTAPPLQPPPNRSQQQQQQQQQISAFHLDFGSDDDDDELRIARVSDGRHRGNDDDGRGTKPMHMRVAAGAKSSDIDMRRAEMAAILDGTEVVEVPEPVDKEYDNI